MDVRRQRSERSQIPVPLRPRSAGARSRSSLIFLEHLTLGFVFLFIYVYWNLTGMVLVNRQLDIAGLPDVQRVRMWNIYSVMSTDMWSLPCRYWLHHVNVVYHMCIKHRCTTLQISPYKYYFQSSASSSNRVFIQIPYSIEQNDPTPCLLL